MIKNFSPLPRVAALLICSISGFLFYSALTPVLAQSVGTTTADILKINSGARPAAMAGVYTALGDDAYAVQYNPAGIAKIQASQAIFTHLDSLADISYEYFIFATAVGTDGALAAAFTYRYMPPIDNQNGNPPANSNDLLGALSYGRKLGDNIRAGLTLKYLQSTLAQYSAGAVMGDIGLQLDRLPFGLKAGLAVQNIGPGMTFNPASSPDPLPMFIRFGLGIHQVFEGQRDFNAALEVFKPSDQDIKLEIGGEGWLFPNLFVVRAGYRMESLSSTTGNVFNNYTLGCSLVQQWDENDFSLDIAYDPANFGSTSQDTFFFGLNVKFNQLRLL